MKNISPKLLPRSLIELYHVYRNEGADGQPAFAYDSYGEWRRGVDAVCTMFDNLAITRGMDGRLLAQEREFFEKLRVNWRGRGIGTLCIADADELSCHNDEQAAALTPYFKRMAATYVAAIRKQGLHIPRKLLEGSIRSTRGKGAPFWIPGTDPLGSIALRAFCRRYYNNLTALERACRSIAPERELFTQTSYIRIQSSRGLQRAWRVGAGRVLEPFGERVGPKVRRIAAQPFLLNHWIAPYGDILRTIMSEAPRGIHAGQVSPLIEVARKGAYKYIFATDLKSYDTTVAYETLRAFQEILVNPCVYEMYNILGARLAQQFCIATPTLIDEIDQRMQTMSILTPSVDPDVGASLWPAEGQTRSGENLTSFKGTCIREAHGQIKLLECGGDPNEDVIFNYGDDTIVLTNNKKLVERWFETPTFLGLKEVASPDSSFLMRRIPQGYAYLGRMVIACINREAKQEPRDQLACASAMAGRYALLNGHPWQDRFFPMLHAYGGPERFQRAVAVAELIVGNTSGHSAAARAIALAQVSSKADSVRKGQPNTVADDRQSLLRQLMDNPYLSEEMRAGLNATMQSMANDSAARKGPVQYYKWFELEEEAKRFSERNAIAYLKVKMTEQRRAANYTKGQQI